MIVKQGKSLSLQEIPNYEDIVPFLSIVEMYSSYFVFSFFLFVFVTSNCHFKKVFWDEMVSLFVFGILTSIKNKLKHLVTLVWSVRHKKYFPTSSASKCLKKKHGRFVKHDCLIKKEKLNSQSFQRHHKVALLFLSVRATTWVLF